MSGKTSAVAAASRPCAVRKAKNGGQKKQPQRGLGVAQLEKLRLQEQQQQQDFSFPPRPPAPVDHQVLDRSLGLMIPQQWPMLPLLPGQHHAALLSQISSSGLSCPGEKDNSPCSRSALHPSSFCVDKLTRMNHHSSMNPVPSSWQDSTQGAYHRSPPPPPPPLLNSASRPPGLPRQQQMEFAVLGTAPPQRNSKELSSFQIDRHQHWTSDDKTTLSSQRKRPRLELWLRPKNVSPPNGSDLGVTRDNAPGGSSPPVEKPVMLATWLEKDDHQTDRTLATGTSLNDSTTPSPTVVNTSCSTVSSSPVVSERRPQVTAAGAFPDVEIESTPLSDFLTLGLASSPRKSLKRNGAKDLHQLTSKSQQKDGTWINWIRIGGKAADGYADGVSLDLNLRLSM
ncbi:uncharacterized protein LOC112347351 [Selaginella moellendorffii]|uniref:uncharacterized protein LOC112347351 n=1 Tax=Selaginella moellendorffii TaxID=88036 RepID=UPI000D1CCC9B|nr:uncharacterized protein LOC112347351 [Selaginella moellendorffii]|eukprot:XP_024533841.1 uncharacterized protein LOC112347351 [Selaginella moellendorffii]